MQYLTKNKKTFLLTIFIFTLSTLSACTGIDTNVFVGAAGQPTDPSSTEVVDVPTSDAPAAITIPAATGRIIFVSNREGQMDLFITSADGSQVSKLVNNIAEDTMPRLSPNGTRVAYVSTANNNTDIYVLDLASGAVTQVTNAPEKDSSPTWSPDGTQLAFETFRDGNFEIYSSNVDGSNQTRLTNDPAADTNPTWSPVANEIAFTSNRFGNADILLTNTSGIIFTLTTNPAPDSAPAWSPDGSFVSYQSFTGELSKICLVGRDGLNGRCVTEIPNVYSPTAWSPDGNWLASSVGTAIQLFNVRDGSTTQVFASGIEPRNMPAFSPDGLRLVFQAQYNGDMEIFSAVILTREFTQITAFGGYDGEAVWSAQ